LNSGVVATGYVSTVVRIQAALEGAGILFLDSDDTAGIGVRLAKEKVDDKSHRRRRVHQR